MSDISDIFGGDFTPPRPTEPDPPEIQLANAITSHGLPAPKGITLDGRVHRFDVAKKGDKRGWYIAYGDGIPAGSFGDWGEGVTVNWCAEIGRELSQLEQIQNANRLAEIKAKREAELTQRRDVAAETAEAIWSNAKPAPADHPYLVAKGIQPHNERVTSDGRLICPMIDENNNLRSVQYISADGTKRFHKGGETGGCYDVIYTVADMAMAYVAEGRATAATIHEVTGKPCVVAYTAGNLMDVGKIVREKNKGRIIFVADNDESGVGLEKARAAAAAVGGEVVMPPQTGDANDYYQAGGDLEALLNPPRKDWLVSADEFSSQPAPMEWLIKGWMPKKSLAMIHGPPAAGKSFFSLDWVLTLSSGLGSWNGHKTATEGAHVYLAGEGHHGLKARIAAWKQVHGVDKTNLFVSLSGCDFNKPDGFAKVCESLMAIGQPILSVTVDTVHRFYDGDENSAKDVREMIVACDQIKETFECAVILVHHTGVSEDSQHRARGSSAWRGALDIEVSIVPGNDDTPMQAIMRKAKDSEMAAPLAFRFEQTEIDGWFDEDGDPVTSVVLKRTEPPAKSAAKSEQDSSFRLFRRHWDVAGEVLPDGRPYLTRSALIDGLIKDGNKPSTAEKKVKPSSPMMSKLIDAGLIEPYEHGWVVVDTGHAGAMALSKFSA